MSYAKLGMAAFGAAAAYGLSRGRGRRALSLKDIQDQLHAELDRWSDDEIVDGVTVVITDLDTGEVYGFDTDGMQSPQEAVRLIDSAQHPFALFHVDAQEDIYRSKDWKGSSARGRRAGIPSLNRIRFMSRQKQEAERDWAKDMLRQTGVLRRVAAHEEKQLREYISALDRALGKKGSSARGRRANGYVGEAEQFAALLRKKYSARGIRLRFDKKSRTGSAWIGSLAIDFSDSTNDPAVIVWIKESKRLKGSPENVLAALNKIQEGWDLL